MYASDDFSQGAQGRRLLQTELLHPLRRTVADTNAQSSRMSASQRRDLHRRNRGMADHGGNDPDADSNVLCCLQSSSGSGKAAVVKVVFVYPQLIEAALLSELVRLDEPRDRNRTCERYADRN